jgi:hypothetical protein
MNGGRPCGETDRPITRTGKAAGARIRRRRPGRRPGHLVMRRYLIFVPVSSPDLRADSHCWYLHSLVGKRWYRSGHMISSPARMVCLQKNRAERRSPPRRATLSRPLRPPGPAPVARSARLGRCRPRVRLGPQRRRTCPRLPRPLSPGAHRVQRFRRVLPTSPQVLAAPRGGTTRSRERGRPSPVQEKGRRRISPCHQANPWITRMPRIRLSVSQHQPPRTEGRPGRPQPPSPSRRQPLQRR